MKEPVLRVLVVDDHEMVRQGLKFMLHQYPDVAVVAEAPDGAAALDSIEAAQPDVVLLDIRMPLVDGLQTLRRIRERWPKLAVLVLSMFDDPEYVEEALQNGANGYLLKGVTADELLRAVRAAAAGAGYIQAEVTGPLLARFVRARPKLDLPPLTARELQLLGKLAEGLSNKQIASQLFLSEATIKGYLSALFDKIGATDRAHAVALALRSRTID